MARRFQDLEAWMLATDLKRAVYALLDDPVVRRDFEFCNQVRDSASGAPRNIAEGFGRYRPAPFALFVQLAIASLMETHDALIDGVDRGYFKEKDAAAAQALADRALRVAKKFHQSLQSLAARDRDQARRRRSDGKNSSANTQ